MESVKLMKVAKDSPVNVMKVTREQNARLPVLARRSHANMAESVLRRDSTITDVNATGVPTVKTAGKEILALMDAVLTHARMAVPASVTTRVATPVNACRRTLVKTATRKNQRRNAKTVQSLDGWNHCQTESV